MLGRQQIAGIPTAISELFKNAHDAYAENVEVDFFRADHLLVLRDDGIGMTEEDFIKRWLAIGTESKLGAGIGLSPPPKPPDIAERPIMGEKGIGRLAIAAIGPQVLILTRANRDGKQYDIVMSFIHWGIFESAGINLDEIDIPVETYKKGALPSRDDVLAMVELFRENIDKLGASIQLTLAERISKDLKRFDVDPHVLDDYLSKIGKSTLTGNGKGTHFLILPTDESLIPDIEGDGTPDAPAPPIIKTLIGFSNTMTSERPPVIETTFRDHTSPEAYVDLITPGSFFTPEEFETADHHFSGEFDEYGQFSGKVTIYRKDPVEHTIEWSGAKGEQTACGPFKLNLAYVQGERVESLLPPEEYAKITRKLNKIGGLYIYKNGIRVLPYGSSDYDFLDIEQRRSKKASYYYFSYRRMFGYVEISGSTNHQLIEKAGREGFIENKAYRQFKSILKHFFLQMAVDFFRESGQHTDAYNEGRAELQRAEEVRRTHEKKVKERRRSFANSLNEFFLQVEDDTPQREASQLLESTINELQALSNVSEPMQAGSVLMEIDANARRGVEALRKRYKITKPRGLGLTLKLRRDWELYSQEFSQLETLIFQPTQQKLDELITDTSHQRHSPANPQKRIERALKERITEARLTVNNEIKATKQTIENVRTNTLQLINTSAAKLESVINEAQSEIARLQETANEEASVLGEYYRLESELSEVTERERQSLENIRNQLQETIEAPISNEDVLEALEEDNLALRESADADIELIQLGMAVAVINHEFESTVRSIRSNLSRLKGWADTNKELRDLYRHVRDDFDHLDAYLELFTPLEKRLARKKVTIRGSEIAKYLRDLFDERLRKEKIDIQSTNIFSRMTFYGYPSNFYPAFVNLVDNAIFWLKDHPLPRIIKLDMIDGSTFVISDNGPGIHPRDREAIFERGFTRKPGGRGMGLKISRDVLAREGWDLTLANSKLGEGASFLIKPKPLNRKGNNNS
jgi:signal transduction histidine kinase